MTIARRRLYARLLYVAVAVTVECSDVLAQTTREKWVLVTTGPTAVMLEPSPASKLVGSVEAGTKLRVYDTKDEWYWVMLPKAENEPAARWGWIPAAMVVPTDPPPMAATPPARTVQAPEVAKATAQEAVAAKPSPPGATAPVPPSSPAAPTAPITAGAPVQRAFLAVNGGYQSSSFDFANSGSAPLWAETRSWTAQYQIRSAPAYEVEGGVRVWRNLFAGLAMSRFATSKSAAAISGQVPNPFFFERFRNISGTSDRLEHIEQAAHVSAIWAVPVGNGFQLSVFGGPSFFFLRRQVVDDVQYSYEYPFLAADFRAANVETVKQTKAGFQAGADLSWFFTDTVGIGAIARFTRAQATVKDTSVDLGGVQAGAGLRIRIR